MTNKKKAPRVGIFMPAYNQGPYIHEAIESLRRQTFQDFELIIADDVSTDGVTPDILRSLQYEKITKIYHNRKNQGISKQTRRFSSLLKNEFFFILCADDKIAPTYIESCVRLLDKNPKLGAVGSWIQNFGEDDSVRKIEPDSITLPAMLFQNNFLGSSIIRRQALEDINYSETRREFRKHYDYDRWVSILEAGWKLAIIPSPLFFYRRLNTSLSHSINIEEEMIFQKAFIKKHQNLFKKFSSDIALHYIEQRLHDKDWVRELQSGRDWLDDQYKTLLSKVQRLEAEKVELLQSRKGAQIKRAVRGIISSVCKKIRKKNKRPKLYAIFAFRYDYKLVPGLLENLDGIIDGYIAHDDRDNPTLWYHEGEIRNKLIRKAREAGADWVLCIDPDERLEEGAKEKIHELIRTQNKKIFSFNFRELWEPLAYRSDGIWDKKRRPNLFPLLDGQEFMNKRVHSVWHPQNQDYEIVDVDINLYHLKNIDPSCRTARKELYKKIDPDSEYQSIGYDYLDDESTLELTKIPQHRLYKPAYDPSIKIVQTNKEG